MRHISAKAIILLLAILIAAILIAPGVNLDPVAPRMEWAACLLVIFVNWLAAMFACTLLLRTVVSIPRTDAFCAAASAGSSDTLPPDVSSSSLRC